MEVEHNSIGTNNTVHCASVIALPLASRIVMAICTVQNLQVLVGINTGYSSSPADAVAVHHGDRSSSSLATAAWTSYRGGRECSPGRHGHLSRWDITEGEAYTLSDPNYLPHTYYNFVLKLYYVRVS